MLSSGGYNHTDTNAIRCNREVVHNSWNLDTALMMMMILHNICVRYTLSLFPIENNNDIIFVMREVS